jgi:hypothetical protein
MKDYGFELGNIAHELKGFSAYSSTIRDDEEFRRQLVLHITGGVLTGGIPKETKNEFSLAVWDLADTIIAAEPKTEETA